MHHGAGGGGRAGFAIRGNRDGLPGAGGVGEGHTWRRLSDRPNGTRSISQIFQNLAPHRGVPSNSARCEIAYVPILRSLPFGFGAGCVRPLCMVTSSCLRRGAFMALVSGWRYDRH